MDLRSSWVFFKCPSRVAGIILLRYMSDGDLWKPIRSCKSDNNEHHAKLHSYMYMDIFVYLWRTYTSQIEILIKKYSMQRILIHKKANLFVFLATCTQSMQWTWWPVVCTTIVTGSYRLRLSLEEMDKVWSGSKPLPKPMLTQIYSVTRPQWVN